MESIRSVKRKKVVVLLSGKMNSGKNKFAEIATKYCESLDVSTATLSFAQPLKGKCSSTFAPLTDFINRTLQKLATQLALARPNSDAQDYISFSINQMFAELYTVKTNWYSDKNNITRAILQAVGTGIVREMDPAYWAKCVRDEIRKSPYQAFFITDYRFPNEADTLADDDLYVVTVRMTREAQGQSAPLLAHSSEQSLDNDELWNYVVDNKNSSLDEFEDSVQSVLHDIICNILEVENVDTIPDEDKLVLPFGVLCLPPKTKT
jgi:hypothetical protein